MNEESFLKFVVIGDCSTGKTRFIHQLIFNKFQDTYNQTIGCDFLSKKFYIDNGVVNVQIWDTPGQEKYWCFTNIFWMTSDALIIMFDVTKESTFKNLDFWLKQFRSKCPNKLDIPIMVLGNKAEDNYKREVQFEDLKKWCVDNKISLYFEISSSESLNIKESIIKLSQKTIEYKKEKLFENEDEDLYINSNGSNYKKAYLLNDSIERSFKNNNNNNSGSGNIYIDNTNNQPSISCLNIFSCFQGVNE